MQDIGRLMLFAGMVLAVLGGVVWLLGRAGFRGLPGDISYQSDHVRVYFPLVTCIVVSIVLTLAMWLWNRIGRR